MCVPFGRITLSEKNLAQVQVKKSKEANQSSFGSNSSHDRNQRYSSISNYCNCNSFKLAVVTSWLSWPPSIPDHDDGDDDDGDDDDGDDDDGERSIRSISSITWQHRCIEVIIRMGGGVRTTSESTTFRSFHNGRRTDSIWSNFKFS